MTGNNAPRTLRAHNASAMTLDGTRTFLVGRQHVAIIDPGPDDTEHLDAIADAVGDGAVTAILLTHLHPDHAAAAPPLARRTGAPIRASAHRSLRHGDIITTDHGELRAIATPGHTPDHTAFHWPHAGAAFVGDLLMGGQDSALVAPPEGDLGLYLASLHTVRELHASTLFPAHGPPFDHPTATIDTYLRHRQDRLRQVSAALQEGPLPTDAIRDAVYGTALDPALRHAASMATEAYLAYLSARGQATSSSGFWRLD